MKNRVLITGSSSGIGWEFAKSFASAGYHLVLHGLDTDIISKADYLSNTYQVDVHFAQHDLSNAVQAEQLIDFGLEKMGGIDVLVNNAGIQYVSSVEHFPNSSFEKIIQVNLMSNFYLSKRVWSFMAQQNYGRIINVSSVHGIRASAYKSAYVAAKHGVVGLTKVLALEGAGLNITCNAICPGYVETPLVQKQIESQALAHNISKEEVVEKIMLSKQAVKKFISPSILADMALLLCKDESESITGSIFTFDGGWSAQ